MLTIDKFEEASEVVKRVTQDTKLIFSDYFMGATFRPLGKIYYLTGALFFEYRIKQFH